MDEKERLAYYKQTGSLQVLGQLYSPYMSLLYGVCYKYLQDQEQSEDAVMQIFEELIDKLKVHEVANFKSWLYVYARNYCLMQIRRDKNTRHVDIEANLHEAEQQVVQTNKVDWEEQDFNKLETCLSGLNSGQEQCVRMFYLEQKCYKDIVEETGYELNKVKSYIQNGKRNLKICMDRK